MGLRDGFRWLVGRDPTQDRATISTALNGSSASSLEDLIGRIRPIRSSPWRAAGQREALGVPAVFKAVSLISNTVGSLSMEGYRAGAKLPVEDTPRLVIRPNPLTRPHEFWRDSAFNMARLGEAWWWTAKRDTDDSPMSLIPVDPREVNVEQNPANPMRPIIHWREALMRNEDMTQITYLPDPNSPLRGWGPLQACGAAVSVAVEAQEWAANWFAGNPSNTWIKSAVDVNKDEAMVLKLDWISDFENLPKVSGPVIDDVKDIGTDPERAQMTEARNFANGEIALMFSIPSTLLNYAVQGSTITYQNVGQVADDFLRQCLLPHYLEPMEQAMSDLLTRATIGRFNVEALLRADIRTRYDVYNVGIPLGVISVEEARAAEGFGPGDVENRPVPFAPPAAVPASLPVQTRSLQDARCPKCNRLNGRYEGYAEVVCRKCGTQFSSGERLQLRSEQSQPQLAPAPVINVYNNIPEWREPARQEPIVVQAPASPAITVNNVIPPPLVEGAVNLVETAAPVVHIAEARARKRIVTRDEAGRITGLEDVPDGAQPEAV
jgi:HK97 family phage portal protein